MEVIDTAKMDLDQYAPEVALWVYNGFDVMVPHDLLREVGAKLSPTRRATYDLEMSWWGPALSMMDNGVLVDPGALASLKAHYRREEASQQKFVNDLATAWWGRGLNVNSNGPGGQMQQFWYFDEDGFQLRPRRSKDRARRVTCDRDALESIMKESYYGEPICRAILALKDIQSKMEFLARGLDADGRVRCSFNVSATETGRWSSSKNPFGGGGNFQNQTEEVRKIYCPDEGWVLAYPDLEQAESRGVAYYSGDQAYISAVESGNVHIAVAKMVWPELEWTGDSSDDKRMAAEPFYRHFSRYDLAKRGGHGTNYLGRAQTMARKLKVPTTLMEEFQSRYFNAFPGIPRWHQEVQRLLQSEGILRTPVGRERTFFGRLNSDDTLREAVAFLPQSLISDLVKRGTYEVWKVLELGSRPRLAMVLGDVHDGTLWQIREDALDRAAPQIISAYTIPVDMPGGEMTIPVDLAVGYRWQKDEMLPWREGVLSSLERPSVVDSLLDIDAEGI